MKVGAGLAEWLVIPFAGTVQVAPGSIIGRRAALRFADPLSFPARGRQVDLRLAREAEYISGGTKFAAGLSVVRNDDTAISPLRHSYMTHAEQDAGKKGPDNAPGASAESPSLRRLYCSTVRTQVGALQRAGCRSELAGCGARRSALTAASVRRPMRRRRDPAATNCRKFFSEMFRTAASRDSTWSRCIARRLPICR